MTTMADRARRRRAIAPRARAGASLARPRACAGKTAGYRRACIVFYIGNDAAERCYTKAGFTFAEEKRDPEFEALTGAPGFRRFERDL